MWEKNEWYFQCRQTAAALLFSQLFLHFPSSVTKDHIHAVNI